jgi:hypothetical protein
VDHLQAWGFRRRRCEGSPATKSPRRGLWMFT